MMETITIDKEDVFLNTVLNKTYTLILHNDDITTFDEVIYSLMEICGHTREQGEQIALIVHNKGKAGAKNGEYDELEVMSEKFSSRHISTTIESND